MNDPVTRRLSAQLSSGIGGDWCRSTDSGIVETESSQISYTVYWLVDWLVCTSVFVCAYACGNKRTVSAVILQYGDLVAGVTSTCCCTKFCCVCLLVLTWGWGSKQVHVLARQAFPCWAMSPIQALVLQHLYGQEVVGHFARIVWGLSWKTHSAYYARRMVLVAQYTNCWYYKFGGWVTQLSVDLCPAWPWFPTRLHPFRAFLEGSHVSLLLISKDFFFDASLSLQLRHICFMA